jgi:hypothetical protein
MLIKNCDNATSESECDFPRTIRHITVYLDRKLGYPCLHLHPLCDTPIHHGCVTKRYVLVDYRLHWGS